MKLNFLLNSLNFLGILAIVLVTVFFCFTCGSFLSQAYEQVATSVGGSIYETEQFLKNIPTK